MNIVPNLEQKVVKKQSELKGKYQEKSFFVQKKFPKRIIGEKYRHINLGSKEIDCDGQMNDLADRANLIGLKT